MIEIPLTQGQVTFIDDIDADLAQYSWCAAQDKTSGTFYAQTHIGKGLFRKTVLLHRLIAERIVGRQLLRNELVDHIHHITLDNRRSEIRVVSDTESVRNRRAFRNNKSGYKGVYWHKQMHKWCAKIRVNGSNILLGYFDDAALAALAYNDAALEHFGEHAYVNEVEQ